MISIGQYKNRTAVILETAKLRAAFLPEDGAKMASLLSVRDDRELLAVKPGTEYGVLTYDGSYVEAECSGFDDMFPTVDPYTPQDGPFQGLTYPDHGETCRIPYEFTAEKECITFRAHSKRFPIAYEKTVAPATDGGIDVSYRVINEGTEPFPYLWAGHIMLAGQEVDQVITPFNTDTPTEMMFATKGFDTKTLPKDRLMPHEPGKGAAYKFYYLEPMPEGRFGVRYRDGSKLIFNVDPEKLPYLGIWLNNGSFQDGYSVTPEPCSVPFDAPDRAEDRGYTSVIPAGETFAFTFHITIEEDRK